MHSKNYNLHIQCLYVPNIIRDLISQAQYINVSNPLQLKEKMLSNANINGALE
jgi:hypothetical protein